MTLKDARATIRALDLVLKPTGWDDYTVNRRMADHRYRPEAAYYTNDLQDAVDTARNWKD